MPKPSYEALQKKVARLEKELARLKSTPGEVSGVGYDLAENANSIILRLDTEGRFIFINSFAQRFFEYGSDEIMGRSVIGTIVPETESTGRDLALMIRDICAHPESYANNENENMKKDGSRVWVSWTNRAVPIDGSRNMEILCVGNDITQLKIAERNARESEERYRSLFDSLLTIIYIHDFNGNFIDVNESGLKLFGYTREEISSLSFKDVIEPEDLAKAMKETKKIVSTGFSDSTVEYRLRTKSGEIKHVEVTASMLNLNGRPYAIQGIARDITANLKAKEALRESEEKFFKAFNKSPLLTVISTVENGLFIEINERFLEMTGYLRDEVIGKTSLELNLFCDSRDREAVADKLRTMGSIRNARVRIRTKQGALRWGLFSADTIVLGQKKYLLTMMNDITDQLQAEEELRNNEAVLRSMLEAVPVGVGLLVDRVLQKVNPSLCAITGYSETEMLGRNTRLLYPSDDEWQRIGNELYGQMEREGLGIKEAQLKRKEGLL